MSILLVKSNRFSAGIRQSHLPTEKPVRKTFAICCSLCMMIVVEGYDNIMFRSLLTFCFTLTSLFGQTVCYCATRSGCEAFRAALSSDATPSNHSCCPTNQSPASSVTPEPNRSPGECPCKKNKRKVSVARTETSESLAISDAFALGFPSLFAARDIFARLLPISNSMSDSARIDPSISTDDLLFLHHRLRC